MGFAAVQNWPVSPLVACEFSNVRRIHPLMQRYVEELVDACRKLEGVRKVFVFGSAITGWCSDTSDIDVLIETDFEFDPTGLKHPGKFDIRFSTSLSKDSDLPSFVREAGVCVYG